MLSKHFQLLIFISFLLFCNNILSQKNYKKYYKDQIPEGSKIKSAGYNWTIEETSEGLFVYATFFPSTKQRTDEATFLSKRFEVKDGPYNKWFDNGEPYIIGHYTNNERTGLWKEYMNGSVSQGEYLNNQKSGIWESYGKDGHLLSRTNYKEGKIHGSEILFDSLGNISVEKVYNLGELVDSLTVRYDGKPSIEGVEEMPRFPGCEELDISSQEKEECSKNEMLKYVYSNMKYPSKARNNSVEGTVLCQFVVGKDGSIQDINTLRGVCTELKNEVEKLVHQLPDFRPGYQEGEAVKVLYTLPVRFKLE